MWALPGLPPRMPRNHLKSSETEGSPNSSSNTAKISGPCMQRRTAGAFASTCAAGVLSIPPRVSSAASSSTASLPGRSQPSASSSAAIRSPAARTSAAGIAWRSSAYPCCSRLRAAASTSWLSTMGPTSTVSVPICSRRAAIAAPCWRDG